MYFQLKSKSLSYKNRILSLVYFKMIKDKIEPHKDAIDELAIPNTYASEAQQAFLGIDAPKLLHFSQSDVPP